MGDDVFVKFASIPMTALLMEQVLSFVIGPIKIFFDFNRYFHFYALSANFDMDIHNFPPFLNVLKIQKRREVNGSGLKNRLETKNARWESIPKGKLKAIIVYTMPVKVRMIPVDNPAFFEASTPVG